MKVKEAAIKVLEEAHEPLRTEEITHRMLKKGYWSTKGKTPDLTVNAQLAVDVKKKKDLSRFIRTGPKTFGLRKWSSDTDEYEDHVAASESGVTADVEEVTKTSSFADCAVQVLQQFGKKKPMHYREITRISLEQKWLQTEGKTPEASMFATITNEIKRFKKRGSRPRFILHGDGYIGLAEWESRGLAFQIEQHNRRVRKEMHQRLLKMDAVDFEAFVAQLLAELGFVDVEMTERSGDGGIDVRGTLVIGDVIQTKMAVQVKRWRIGRNVQSNTVREVRGSLGAHEQGLIITTSEFSKGARVEAERADAIPVGLMNGEQFVLLLLENEVGVQRKSYDLFDIPDDEH